MNKFEQRSTESYNKKAVGYDNSVEGLYTAKFKEMLCDSVDVPPGGKLLDVACGNGRLLQKLSEKSSFYGYGADISPKMIECAKQENPGMTFEVACCDKLPFEGNLFDVLTVSAAFHHFPDPRAFAKEAHRVLKSGGRLYIADVYYPAIIRVLCNPFVPLSGSGDVKFYAPKEIKRIFEEAGFKQKSFEISGHIQLVMLVNEDSKTNE